MEASIRALAYVKFLRENRDKVLRMQREALRKPLPCWYDEKQRRWVWIESSS